MIHEEYKELWELLMPSALTLWPHDLRYYV